MDLNIKEKLEEANRKYNGKDDILGRGILTFPDKISSSRHIMFNLHLEQLETLINPQIPRVFTNYENAVGKYSTAYNEAESDYEVVAKISKFNTPELKNHIYLLVVYDKRNKMYDVIQKEHGVNLTESYGYVFNNKRLDSKMIGDEIEQGEILSRSTSFDENMNYRFGLNAKTVYLIDNDTIEDAMVVSRSFSERMVSKKLEIVKISINDNDVLINMYGKHGEYKSFPDIGEDIKDKMIAVKRRIDYSQTLFDLKHDNLSKPNFFTDDPFYVDGRVVDIDLYCNKEMDEIVEDKYNGQLVKYLKLNNDYHTNVFNILGDIMKSGEKYSDELAYIFKRSRDTLNPDIKWKDDKRENTSNVFNNIIISFLVERDCPLAVGSKLVGRYGNKGVLSKILPDDQMPMLDDGNRVDIICNALGIVNRLNPSQLYELEVNFICNRVREKMAMTDSLKEKRELLFDITQIFNPKQADDMRDFYKELDDNERINFIMDAELNGIYINLPPMWDNISLSVIAMVYERYPWIKPYTCYINRFGRKIKMMNKLIVGEQYFVKLKHHAFTKFSARSTGMISPGTNVPSKSQDVKKHRAIISRTPIRLGEMENSNTSVNMNMEAMRRLTMLYRSSAIGRRQTGKLFTGDALNIEKIETGEGATNINAVKLNVLLKTVGVELEFEDDNGDTLI